MVNLRQRRGVGGNVLQWVVITAVAIVIGFAIGGFPQLPGSSKGEARVAAGPATTSTAPSTTTSTTSAAPPEPPLAAAEVARSPKEVKVRLYNGSSVGGAAVTVGQRLAAAGFDVQSPGPSTPPGASTLVYHRPGSEADATAVANALSVPASAVALLPDPPPVKVVGEADVLVVVGDDLAKG